MRAGALQRGRRDLAICLRRSCRLRSAPSDRAGMLNTRKLSWNRGPASPAPVPIARFRTAVNLPLAAAHFSLVMAEKP